jgi:hypothetical protein
LRRSSIVFGVSVFRSVAFSRRDVRLAGIDPSFHRAIGSLDVRRLGTADRSSIDCRRSCKPTFATGVRSLAVATDGRESATEAARGSQWLPVCPEALRPRCRSRRRSAASRCEERTLRHFARVRVSTVKGGCRRPSPVRVCREPAGGRDFAGSFGSTDG